ncbi:outer membrane beta-barrel family protein [Persicobacter diffluens]|uniref:TonB-dependent receptor n=1 Tax=Persicobacter diffluens TaxID=981 RepID=A0AAN4VUH9_9BACT|nr:TonB-dependent receptor [Persicobacter diffluens]
MKHFLFSLLLFVPQLLWAQSKISGTVVDGENQAPLSFAQVALFEKDQLVTGGMTDLDGKFELKKVPAGDFQLQVSFVGYHAHQTAVKLAKGEDLKLGKIGLGIDAKQLESVEVTGQRETATRQIDRQVFNAEDFATARSGAATDLLRNIPSVSISPDGEVSLRGTSGFLVYIDGKPTQIEPSVLLQQIPAASIKNIEVITVPSARYEAQGNAGIINITTTGNVMQGTTFTADVMGGGTPWHEGMDPRRYSGSMNFTHAKDKWTLYGGASYSSRDVRGSRTGDARILQEDGSYYHMQAAGDRPEWHRNATVNLGVSYDFSESSKLNASYYYGFKEETRTADYYYHNFIGDIDGNPIAGRENEVIFNPNTHAKKGAFQSWAMDYEKKWESGIQLNVAGLYEKSRLWGDLDNKNQESNHEHDRGELLVHYRQHDNNPLDGYRLSFDFTIPVAENQKIETGFQPQWLRQGGDFDYEDYNISSGEWETPYSNGVDLRRDIYAAYVNYGASFNKLKMNAGLRFEYTDQELELENTDYQNIFDPEREGEKIYETKQPNVFPSLMLDYQLAEDQRLILSGSRRINRPPTKNMAPFLWRRHYEVYEIGDPTLQPEYINNIEASYSRDMAIVDVMMTAFYRATENAIFRVNTVDQEQNVLMRSYTNAGNDQALGLELNTNWRLGSKVKLFVGGSLYAYAIQGDIFDYTVDTKSTNWTINTNLNAPIVKGLAFAWDMQVKSATVTAQGENDLFYLSNVALNYTPKKMDQLQIALRVEDVFGSNIKGLNTAGYNGQGDQIFFQDTEYYRYGPIMELGLTYRFQSGKSKKVKKTNGSFGKEQF